MSDRGSGCETLTPVTRPPPRRGSGGRRRAGRCAGGCPPRGRAHRARQGPVVHGLRKRERRPRRVSGAAVVATPLRSETRSRLVLALQASTATLEEAAVAELLLGQVVMAADRLVV